jgi:acetylornithine deacetylase
METNHNSVLHSKAISLLQELISTPSFSREEDKTATIIENFLNQHDIVTYRVGNNIFSINEYFDKGKPSILLNSHHDTVKPNPGYTRDPFDAKIEDGKLFGLGSNDAGGCLVSLIATYLHFESRKDLPFNVVLAATAEEEISGPGGVEALIKDQLFLSVTEGAFTAEKIIKGTCAIVGEPTKLQMAVAERGLLVIDCIAPGKAGHAARNEGENAIYNAIADMNWIREYKFPKESELLGANKMTVTVIETENKAHNVVPAVCKFVVDARVNELYTFEEVLAIIQENIKSEVKPRSTRLRSTSIALDHPLVKAGTALGLSHYGSPTTSDKALMPFQALKMGPGDSARSHTANEYIYTEEIEKGIDLYIQIINGLMQLAH